MQRTATDRGREWGKEWKEWETGSWHCARPGALLNVFQMGAFIVGRTKGGKYPTAHSRRSVAAVLLLLLPFVVVVIVVVIVVATLSRRWSRADSAIDRREI